jgi:hypothetical protein
MVFRGLCTACRDAVRAGARREGRDVAVAEYEPKMNVTPNAVALKDDSVFCPARAGDPATGEVGAARPCRPVGGLS